MLRPTPQYILFFITALILLIAQLLLKQGMKQAGAISITNFQQLIGLFGLILTTPLLLAGLCLSGVSTLLWLITLSRSELSYAVPVVNGIYYLMILLASVLLLGEQVTPQRCAGALLIIVALALLK